MLEGEAAERALDILLPHATEFQKIAIMELKKQAGDLSKGMPAPGSEEERALMELGEIALDALGWKK